jgi:hypothetical protein
MKNEGCGIETVRENHKMCKNRGFENERIKKARRERESKKKRYSEKKKNQNLLL